MLAGIEALVAIDKFETMSEAAVRLRITQSAVSKRIQALQRTLGVKLLERDGRRVALTPQAQELLERARPLVAELRELTLARPSTSGAASFSLALADSIAASWGPSVVSAALLKLTGISVDLHSHRSVLIVESVRLGRYQLGLTAELPSSDLVHHPIVEEPMVLVRARGRSARRPLISIEPTSATWRAIQPQLEARHPKLLERKLIPVESFSAALQMVKAGFGNGLIPLGLALEARLRRDSYRTVAGVTRPISLISRKMVHHLSEVARFRDRLEEAARSYFAKYQP